jgi:peptidoglycan hydrolase-like protein with peptidoglycan-binding domain
VKPLRRRLAAGGAALIVVGGAGYAIASSGSNAGASDGLAVETGTATVKRATLVDEETFDGTLGYGTAVSVSGGRGTVTGLPAVGSIVERGGALFEVDGRNVPLLYGKRPQWRTLAEGMGDGLDVKQLEENLVALGHATKAQVGVDQTFNAATTAAVKRFQAAHGLEQDGVLDIGEVVFLDGAVRIAEHAAAIGSPAGGPVVKASSASKVITFDLEAGRQDLLAVGDTVDLELPGGQRVPGKVTSIASVAQAADNGMGLGGDPTVEVVVTPDDPGTTGGLDGAPVDIHIERDKVTDALAVPVNALLALAEGGYAVEVVGPSGNRALTAVETGMFADGLVEVRGDGIAAGTSVVVPK